MDIALVQNADVVSGDQKRTVVRTVDDCSEYNFIGWILLQCIHIDIARITDEIYGKNAYGISTLIRINPFASIYNGSSTLANRLSCISNFLSKLSIFVLTMMNS